MTNLCFSKLTKQLYFTRSYNLITHLKTKLQIIFSSYEDSCLKVNHMKNKSMYLFCFKCRPTVIPNSNQNELYQE